MQCNPKKCDQCGMWWKIDGTNEKGEFTVKEGCGHMLIYLKLDMLHRAINGIRHDNHESTKTGVKGLMSLGEALKKQHQSGSVLENSPNKE